MHHNHHILVSIFYFFYILPTLLPFVCCIRHCHTCPLIADVGLPYERVLPRVFLHQYLLFLYYLFVYSSF